MATMPIREVDKVEILTLLDNSIGLLMAGTEQVKRFRLPSDGFTRENLVAEHGFAALVTATARVRVRSCNHTFPGAWRAPIREAYLVRNLPFNSLNSSFSIPFRPSHNDRRGRR